MTSFSRIIKWKEALNFCLVHTLSIHTFGPVLPRLLQVLLSVLCGFGVLEILELDFSFRRVENQSFFFIICGGTFGTTIYQFFFWGSIADVHTVLVYMAHFSAVKPQMKLSCAESYGTHPPSPCKCILYQRLILCLHLQPDQPFQFRTISSLSGFAPLSSTLKAVDTPYFDSRAIQFYFLLF